MTFFMVVAAGEIKAELSNEGAAWSEAESIVAHGYPCAEVFVKLGEVQRKRVEYERLPANLDDWLARKTKEIGNANHD